MSNFRENLGSALQALRESWVRSALTMLGIVIGVGSVVLLVAIGQGVKADVTRQIDVLGANVVIVVPGKPDRFGRPNPMATLGFSTLTQADVDSLRRLPLVQRAAPLMFVFSAVDLGKQSASALVIGTTAAITDILPMKLASGRFFGPQDEGEQVCVLADAPKEDLFGARSPIGASVQIHNSGYRVVGVLKPEEESLFSQFSTATVVWVPFEAARKANGAGQINRIFLKVNLNSAPDVTKRILSDQLFANHGRQDFTVLTIPQLLSAVTTVFNLVTALVVGISAISLVVAGIGIMNIMLVTVTERTREIGIRKTVGARRADVFVQFLTEAVTLSFVGGVIGTLLAWGICVVVARYSPLKPLITAGAILLAFGVCFLVGILFGVAPAMRAARQDPIEALRWE